MSLTAFNRLRRIEAMRPENILQNASTETIKQEEITTEEVVEPRLEEITTEEDISKPSATVRRNRRRNNE